MDEGNTLFFNWMAQPGLVKKLQLALCMSLILNMLFTIQLLEVHKKKIPAMHKEEKIQTKKTNKESAKTISPEQIKKFTYIYLENFFKTSEESINFIQKHTDMNLFSETIALELENRQKQNLTSNFTIEDLYLEELNEKDNKVIVIGQETFTDTNYQARNLTIELIIDKENLRVKAIPLFKVKS